MSERLDPETERALIQRIGQEYALSGWGCGNTVAVAIPLPDGFDDALMLPLMRANARVDLTAMLQFVDYGEFQQIADDEDITPQMTEYTLRDVPVVRVHPQGTGEYGVNQPVITVGVTPDDARVLTWLIESQVPFDISLRLN